MSEDIINLLDELSIDKACLLGHSMGGKMSMVTALQHVSTYITPLRRLFKNINLDTFVTYMSAEKTLKFIRCLQKNGKRF